jgi:hypothetical protein
MIRDEQPLYMETTIRLIPAQDARVYTASARPVMLLVCWSLLELLALVQFAAADSWRALGGGWSRYSNERFGTVLDVPLNRFEVVEPPPENGDGREFRGEDGARLLVYGTYAPFAIMSSFEEYKNGLAAEAKRRGVTVTYERGGKGWLVFSGLEGGTIIYTKVVERCDAAHAFTIEYPASRKTFYDPIVARLSRSLGCTSPRTSRSP